MPIRTKYREVIELLNQLGAEDLQTWEVLGDLKITARLKSEHDRKLVEDKIKELNYMEAEDIEYKFTV